ncbi:folate-binding protein YgfZ [Devosia sp. WQ 349]|uniref:CAF17-like 4Fe-4S cluster assembly/insertion protein YgfZ n=1 Tax=Devosia sp. WQ 349K1 TaxID=2800329 RepID=UPI001907B8CA|nr:folate-binding protein YgfZ [Devosia sp. WQ 349K1]MBK1794477.1 folate-binding protein YgfZ [Devosia sp. WQ 349K1]
MTIHHRADRAVFRFSGPDAHRLLNDVLTGHIPSEAGSAAWFALLSPQGKILAEGLAGWAEDGIWLDVHESVGDDFFKRMRMYKLRANLEISDLRASHSVGFSADAVEGAVCHGDRFGPIQIGFRVIDTAEAAAEWDQNDTPYHAARIANGVLLQGNDFAANDAFAHDLGMDMLDGIDFVKGCYVGQEVVSRMKHRGTARRRPVIVSGVTGVAGDAVVASGRDAGTLGQVVDGRAVAIVRLDRVSDVGAVTVNGAPVTVSLPGWASYGFGDVAAEE